MTEHRERFGFRWRVRKDFIPEFLWGFSHLCSFIFNQIFRYKHRSVLENTTHGSCTFGWKDGPAVQTYITRKREVPVTCDASVVSIRKSCRNKWTLKKYSVINSNVCLIVLFYTNGMGIKCDPLTVMLWLNPEAGCGLVALIKFPTPESWLAVP